MEKKMEQIIVRATEDGQIEIAQDLGMGDAEHGIFINPEQVDALVKWLHEAKEELEQKK